MCHGARCYCSQQIESDIAYLKDHGVEISEFWLDIESSDWGSNHTWNTRFIERLASKASSLTSARVGIYSSHSQWEPITGDSHDLKQYPLWWATYNYQPSFSGFVAFGGWKTPFMHQYKGSVGLCGANVDVNWRP